MKTIFRRIFFLVVLVLFAGLNVSYADNRSVDEIKNEIQILKEQFEASQNNVEKKEISDKVEKLVDEFLAKQSTTTVYKNGKSRSFGYCSRAFDTCGADPEWYNDLTTGDIIVVKGKDPDKWTSLPGIGGWGHAFMVYDNYEIFEIKGPEYTSSKYPISEIKERIDKGYYTEVALVKMGLSYSQKRDMRNYIDKHLIGKIYGLPSSVGMYYCSSLVWKAHKSSGKKVDLDDDGGIVYPIDLITSDNIGEVQHYYY